MIPPGSRWRNQRTGALVEVTGPARPALFYNGKARGPCVYPVVTLRRGQAGGGLFAPLVGWGGIEDLDDPDGPWVIDTGEQDNPCAATRDEA